MQVDSFHEDQHVVREHHEKTEACECLAEPELEKAVIVCFSPEVITYDVFFYVSSFGADDNVVRQGRSVVEEEFFHDEHRCFEEEREEEMEVEAISGTSQLSAREWLLRNFFGYFGPIWTEILSFDRILEKKR